MRLTEEALVRWAELRDAEGGLPELVRRLIRATVEPASLEYLEMPSEEGISKPGVDGLVKVREGNDFVPRGTSVWEIGRNKHFRAKAQQDYRKRTDDPPPGLDTGQATFVFVTPRRWPQPALNDWQLERRAEKVWRDVVVIDADKLIEWVRAAPPVEVWLAERLGWSSPLRSLERAWREWSRATIPASSEALVLAGRNEQRETLRVWLERPPGVLQIHASDPDEAEAFCWASLRHLPASVREGWFARALVVRSEDELRRLSVERTPMLLLARGCGIGLARLAAAEGHHVLVSDAVRPVEGVLELGPLDPPRVEVALEGMGYAEDARRLILGLRGMVPGVPGLSMSALRRALGDVSDELPAELAPLVLAGAWTERTPDVEAVCELLGEGPGSLRALQRRHSGAADAPLVVSGERWRWASRRDAWRQLEPRLSAGELGRFQEVVIKVIEGDACSGELRLGLLEGVLLLAAASERSEGEKAADRVAFALLNSRGRGWARLENRGLALLAEAAPQVFLNRARERLDEGEVEPNSAWVWALEVLAWSDEHLLDVSELLAHIGDTVEAGVGEQARRSFKEIYLSWHPHTCASVEVRAANLEALARQRPDFIFDRLLELLPKVGLGGLSMETQHPKIRDWDQGHEPVTGHELRDYGLRLWAQIKRMVKDAPGLWLRLFPELTKLSLSDELRDEAFESFCILDGTHFDPTERDELRRALRAKIHHHRQFADADWSRLERFEQLHEALAPPRSIDALAWMFDRGAAPLHLPSRGASWRARDNAVQEARRDAAQRLREDAEPGELVALAERVGDPRALGFALGSLEDEQPPMALLRASLGMDADAGGEFRRGLGRALYKARKFEAVLDGSLESLPASAQAELLLGHPWWPSTWDIVDRLEPALGRAYWQRAPIVPYEDENVDRLMRSILGVGRVRSALELADSSLTLNKGSLEPALLVELLDAAAQEIEPSNADRRFASRALHMILERLRAQGDQWSEELRRLEWTLLPCLDLFEGHHPKTLYAKLAEDPANFVELVHLAHPQEEITEHEWNEQDKGQSLLFHWNTVPGQRGTEIDFDELLAWIMVARAQLREAGLQKIGDRELGKVLARVPPCSEDSWPAQALCQLLEELDPSRTLEDALANERGNRLSTQVRFVDPERDRREADALHDRARSMRARWPRMARVIEQLAQSREHHAQFWQEHEDERINWTGRATTQERLDAALDKLEASGRYVFELDDLDETLRRAGDLFQQLDKLPRVAALPHNAYVIVRPEYRTLGAPPPSWFIDELMRRAQVDYCVGLLSAAALHGAADQKPQVFQVLVTDAMDPARVGKLAIEFVHREREQSFEVCRLNTETGTMAVATPEATFFDLAEFTERCGGRGAVVAVYEELLDELSTDALVNVSASYPAQVVERAAALSVEAGHGALATALRERPQPKAVLGA